MQRRLKIAILIIGCIVASVVLAAGASNEFVGAEACSKCHQEAFDAWSKSAHARSRKALDSKQSMDPRCTQCHGDGGRGVAGIQCESCHGAGKHYARRYVMKDKVLARIVGLVPVAESTCLRCHTDNNPSIVPFVFEKKWLVIEHGQNRPQASDTTD